jgi:hypothetical protein
MEGVVMIHRSRVVSAVAAVLCVLSGPASAQDKNSVKVPGGLGFAEFKGYEQWEFISFSQGGPVAAAILGNPAMIAAYKAGIPANGKPVPDGAKMAKIHWTTKQSTTAPAPTTVPGTLHDVDFMVKDSKRFASSGGWGYAAFKWDEKTGKFSPATTADQPPQGNDATCGFGCHSIVKNRDYVFTEYQKR